MDGITFASVLKRSAIALGAIAIAGLSGCVVYVRPGRVVAWGPPPVVYQPAPPVVYAPPPPEYGPPPAPPVQASSDQDLQRLVAPIALYPDPLLADILPASTFPDQIQAAAAWLQANPAPTDDQIAAQPWDPTVQALVHYPTILTYMSSEIDWTRSLGSAVGSEQPDVMAAVQDLRVQAYNDGSLHDTPQQRVVVEGDPTIYILPVDPDYIYVPVYDPVLVYSQSYVITFGPQFIVGPWFVHGFDWDRHVLFVGDWHGPWIHGPYGWRRDPGWGPGRYHAWARDGRWGPGPHVDHFAFRNEVAREQWHPVAAVHRDEVRNLRQQGRLPQQHYASPSANNHTTPNHVGGQPGGPKPNNQPPPRKEPENNDKK